MKVPLFNEDFEKHTLTRIARALMKAYPGHPIGLSRSQNIVAKILGYDDLHSAQGAAFDIVERNSIEAVFDIQSIHKVANEIIAIQSGMESFQCNLPFEMLVYFHENELELDSKIWYRIEKKFCDAFFGTSDDGVAKTGKLFNLLSEVIDFRKPEVVDLSEAVCDVIDKHGNSSKDGFTDHYFGTSLKLLNEIVDGDEASALSDGSRMYMYENLAKRHLFPAVTQSIGSLYIDSPDRWCQFSYMATSSYRGHVWENITKKNGVEYTLRFYEMEGKKDSGLKGYTWVYSANDPTPYEDGDWFDVKTLIRGVVFTKKKRREIEEFDLISANSHGAVSMELLFEVLGKLKKKRFMEMATHNLTHPIGAYGSDEAYLNSHLDGSGIVIIEDMVTKVIQEDFSLCSLISLAVEHIAKRLKLDGANVYVYKGKSGIRESEEMAVPSNLGEYSIKRANALVADLLDAGVLNRKAEFHVIGDGF